LGWFGFTFEVGITFDGCGNIRFYGVGDAGPQFTDVKKLNFGPSKGASGNIDGAIGGSTAKAICDLRGWFDNAAISVGTGDNLGAGGSKSDSKNGPVTGGGIYGGVGLGESTWAGPSYTLVQPLFFSLRLWMQLVDIWL
jgi:hypothetical protein